MGKCIKCNEGTMQDAVYRCGNTNYEVVDLSGNVLKTFSKHDLPADDVEIGDSKNVKFCSCGIYFN